MKDEYKGLIGELEREYKRVVAFGAIRNGRAFFKGYLAALHFAIQLVKANEEEAK